MAKCYGRVRSKFDKLAMNLSKDVVKERMLRLFPIFVWLPKYKIADLHYDIIAGLTVGLTMVPQTIAYAQMANLHPQNGLYSSFIGQIIYVFMGTSKDANIGPSAITSVLTGQIAAEVLPNQLLDRGDSTCATLMAFFCGLIMMMMGATQLGFLVNLFSIPVVAGFTSAAGLAIFASQLANFLGIKTSAFRPPGVFVKQIKAIVENWSLINMADLIVGLSCLAFILFMQYMPDLVSKICSCRRSKTADSNQRQRRNAAAFDRFMDVLLFISASRNVIAFVISTGIAYYISNHASQFEGVHITTVGRFAKGFPKWAAPKFYLTNGSDVLSPTPDEEDFLYSDREPIVLRPAIDLLEVLSPGFLIISLMCSMELFIVTKALGRKNNYRVDASQELLAVGLSNFLQSFVGGFPSTSAVTRSALADQCRVKTQLAGLVSTAVILVALGALDEIFQYTPKSCLSAIIIGAAYNLIDFSIIRSMWQLYRRDLFLYAAAFLMCLFWDVAYGVLLCLLLNMISFLRPVVRMKVHVEEQAVSDEDDGESSVVILRLSQGMRYPSADKFTDRISTILNHDDYKHIVIDCQFVTHVDYTGLQAFQNLLLTAIQKSKHIIFTNLNEKLQKHLAAIGMEQSKFVGSVDEAVRLYKKQSNSSSLLRLGRSASGDDDSAEHNDEDYEEEMRDQVGEMASFKPSEAAENPRFLKALANRPSFYTGIPLTVGNISKLDKDKNASKPRPLGHFNSSSNALGGYRRQSAIHFVTPSQSVASSQIIRMTKVPTPPSVSQATTLLLKEHAISKDRRTNFLEPPEIEMASTSTFGRSSMPPSILVDERKEYDIEDLNPQNTIPPGLLNLNVPMPDAKSSNSLGNSSPNRKRSPKMTPKRKNSSPSNLKEADSML